MKICCICITAGRIRHLNEAIAAFLKQSHPDKHLVILNTLPAQTLCGDFPGVTIINPPERPASLAIARNMAVREVNADAYTVFDDDDGYGVDYLATFAKQFNHDSIGWVWMPQQFYCVGGKVKQIVKGSANVFAFTRKAFDAIGGYSEALTVGEDRDFVSKLTSQFAGIRTPLEGFVPQFYYAWGNGLIHTSGLGDDKPGRVPAWERAKQHFDQQIKQRIIKTGRIELKPEARVDWDKLGADFLAKSNALISKKKPSVALVMPGRLGDIINLLPVALAIHNGYDTPHLVCSNEFAVLLEGVSYVHPHPVPIQNDRLHEILKYAHTKFPIVINGGVWGKDWKAPRTTDSFNKESWKNAGMLHLFSDTSLRPVFDRRNLMREEALWNKVKQSDKPILLVQVTRSISSPFPHGPRVLQAICDRWQSLCEIIDLAEVYGERIFDMLGLLDRAAALICCDTALIHLAAASNIPTVCLVNPQPWLGSVPRANCIRRISYTEAAQEPEIVNGAIKAALSYVLPKLQPKMPTTAPNRRVFHAVERHEEPNDRRKLAAQASWDVLYEQGTIPAHYWEYSRDARQIGDKRALPYLKDVIGNALAQADETDIVFWSNDDNFLHPALPDMLRFHVGVYGAVASQRCEFRGMPIPSGSKPPEYFAKAGRPHMGRDLVAATKAWWEKNWNDIPDFLCGASDFDLCLACMVRLEKGVQSDRKNLEQTMFPCELPRGYVSHTYHAPKWADPKNQSTAPSQLHNRELFFQWGQRNMPTLKFLPGKVL